MFENIGGKIKGFAQAWCWIILIGSVVAWIILLSDWGADEWLPWIVLLSGLAIVPSAWVIYGFGQLIEDAHDLSDDVRALRNQSNEPTAVVEDDELPEL